MKKIESVIEAHKNDENLHRRESWKIVDIHRQIYIVYGEALIKWLNGEDEEYEKLRNISVNKAWEYEDSIQDVFDALYFHRFI